jgi:hypothetical protein
MTVPRATLCAVGLGVLAIVAVMLTMNVLAPVLTLVTQ